VTLPVRVVRTCVCGSDLHPYHDLPVSSRGTAMGHEFLGVVEEIGADVKTVTPGDLVVASFSYQDNTCPICRDGVQTACLHGGFFSTAQAEAVVAPQADGTLVKLPVGEDSNLLPSLLTLADVYGTGYHAAKLARVAPGDTVTVVAERGDEGIAKVRELTGGFGTHKVLEAVGYRNAYDQAIGVVRPGGIISRVGVPQYDEAPTGFTSLFGRNITLNGGPAPVRAYIEELLPAVLDGTVNPGKVFDQTVPLDQIADGYRSMNDRTALKVLVTP
jgi:threonine dehydrogenase-like Zn-dependent dehydrogenase